MWIRTTGKGLAMFIALLVVQSTAMAQADEEYIAAVRAQLAAVKSVYEGRGFQETHYDEVDRLGAGASTDWEYQLQEGVTYHFISVCDQDCGDLDLTLFDESGNQVSEDTTEDSVPIVEVTPRWTGKFTLNVSMYHCGNPPCYYGISVMGI